MDWTEMIYTLKSVFMLPLWLIVLPMRSDHAFRHHDWTVRGMGSGTFSRTAYFFCAVCWISFGLLLFLL
jgi:hypothetical protein